MDGRLCTTSSRGWPPSTLLQQPDVSLHRHRSGLFLVCCSVYGLCCRLVLAGGKLPGLGQAAAITIASDCWDDPIDELNAVMRCCLTTYCLWAQSLKSSCMHSRRSIAGRVSKQQAMILTTETLRLLHSTSAHRACCCITFGIY